MRRRTRPGLLALTAALVVFAASVAQPAASHAQDKKPRLDLSGDPLPDGAIARIGTARLMPAAPVRALVYANDDKWLVSAGDDKAISVWDSESGKLLRVLTGHEKTIAHLAMLPAGAGKPATVLVSASDDLTVRQWDLATGKELPAVINHAWSITALAVSPDGKILATASKGDPNIYLWRASDCKELRHWKGHRKAVLALAFAPDGKSLASGGHGPLAPTGKGKELEGSIAIWDPKTGTRIHGFAAKYDTVFGIVYSPDGKNLAAVSGPRLEAVSRRGADDATGVLQIWDLVERELRPRSWNTDLVSMAFSPDGGKVLVAGRNDVCCFRINSPFPEWRTDAASSGRVGGPMAVSTNGQAMAICTIGRIAIHDMSGKKPSPKNLAAHRGPINSICISPDSRILVTSDGRDKPRTWQLETGNPLQEFKPSDTWASFDSPFVFSPDGQTLACGHTWRVTLFDTKDGRQTHELFTAGIGGEKFAFSHDGKQIITQLEIDRDLPTRYQVWDVATGKRIGTFSPPCEQSNSMALAPDGKTFAFAAGDLLLWRPRSGELLYREPANVRDVIYSPDGLLLATIGAAKTVELRLAATGKIFASLGNAADDSQLWVKSIAFCPNGRFLAEVQNDCARLWDLETRKVVHTFRDYRGEENAVAFAPNGKTLVTLGGDGTALVWDLTAILPRETERRKADALWVDMKSANILKAYAAFCRMRESPAATVPWLANAIKPAGPPVSAAETMRLIGELDADDFDTRESASHQLELLGERVEAALAVALKEKRSLEARRRIEQVQARHALDARRLEWSVRLLELFATPDARALLIALGGGVDESRLTQQARQALKGLTKRMAERPTGKSR